MIRGDASEFYALANDLSRVGARAVKPMRGVMKDAGEAFEKEWASNARETAGEHGKHYPDSIGHDLAFTSSVIAVDVGPGLGAKAGWPQSDMVFEQGSRNQPPHLDGLRALDVIAPRVERGIDSALTFLFP